MRHDTSCQRESRHISGESIAVTVFRLVRLAFHKGGCLGKQPERVEPRQASRIFRIEQPGAAHTCRYTPHRRIGTIQSRYDLADPEHRVRRRGHYILCVDGNCQ